MTDHETETDKLPEPPDWAPPPGKLKPMLPGTYWDDDRQRYVSPGEDEWSNRRYREVIGLGVQPVAMYDVVEQRGMQLLQNHWAELRQSALDRDREPPSYIPSPDDPVKFRRTIRYDTLWYKGMRFDYRNVKVRTNLFGHQNLGNPLLCNLEIPNGSPHWWAITHMRVHASFAAQPEKQKQIHRELAEKGQWIFVVAEADQNMGFIEAQQWIPFNEVIPLRQQMKVTATLDDGLHEGLHDLQCHGHIRFELHGVETREYL